MRKGLIIFGAVGLLAILLWAGCKSTRSGYESPEYRVVEKDGVFETRDYPALIVAETSMSADGKDMNSGFNKLFRFITGGNSKTEKIAMTTPVLVNPASSNPSMAFVMPGKYVLSELPQPADESVSLRKIEAARYVVMRFSGSRSRKNREENSARLLAWTNSKDLKPLSAPEFAYYDPPWIPGFLRRNEVKVRVKA
jgi:DNA gyrase inhibitor GyrI